MTEEECSVDAAAEIGNHIDYVWVSSAPESALLSRLRDLGWIILELDARDIDHERTLFAIISHKWGFPDHYGENWDATVDVLSDPEWLPGESPVVFAISHAEYLVHDGQPTIILQNLAMAIEVSVGEWAHSQDRNSRTLAALLISTEASAKSALQDAFQNSQLADLQGRR